MARTIIGGSALLSKKRPQRVIGVDIGSTAIKMIEVSLSERPKLLKWVSMANPVGDISFPETSERELIKLLKKCRKKLMPATRISSLCLSDPALIVKELSLPSMGQKELLENIRFELSEYFSADLNEFRLSYRYLESTSEAKDLISVLVAAAPLSLLRKHRNLLQSSGLNVKYMDVPANAISKLLRRIKFKAEKNFYSNQKEVLCVADIGEKKIDVSIYVDGIYIVNRTSMLDGDNVAEAALSALSQVVDYYHRKNYSLRVSKVMLIGGGAYKEGVSEYLSDQSGMTVEVVRPDILYSFDNVPEDFPAALYFNALGAAIRED